METLSQSAQITDGLARKMVSAFGKAAGPLRRPDDIGVVRIHLNEDEMEPAEIYLEENHLKYKTKRLVKVNDSNPKGNYELIVSEE